MHAYRIEDEVGVLEARRSARDVALAFGFRSVDAAEICIVVSELASNILKYGVRGEIRLEPADDPLYGRGMRVVARDEGPPFHDLTLAVRDGYDDRGPLLPERYSGRAGIGGGLGAVVRFTDTFACEAEPLGKRIVVVRFVRRPRPPRPDPTIPL